ncbi:MAG: hypothetical protein EOO22_05485 [Comamonadaceae bacterium]|nr:MAG: hypothetical protein EOO22_05485 [Comamonadaceae bacterium]
MIRRPPSVTLQQAVEQSPTLASLATRSADTQNRLRSIQSLIPPELRPAVQAGPVGEKDWCLLVEGSAAAAKLRQLLPSLQARLRMKGWEVCAIRLKVRSSRRG